MAAGGAELAPCREAGDDRLFPVGSAAGAYLEVGDHAPDGGEQLVIDVADVLEVVVPGCVGEDERGDAFFDGDRAAAVFGLVDLRIAFAFASCEGSEDRGPAEHGGVGEVEDVMEPVVIFDEGGVGEGVADTLPAASHGDDGSASLPCLRGKGEDGAPGELLAGGVGVVEHEQRARGGFPPVGGLDEAGDCDVFQLQAEPVGEGRDVPQDIA